MALLTPCNAFYRSVMHNARFIYDNFMVLVGMEGFEPTQAVPPDLQSGPIHQSLEHSLIFSHTSSERLG